MKRAGFFSDNPSNIIRVGRDVRNHLGKLDPKTQVLAIVYLTCGRRFMGVLGGDEPDYINPSRKVTPGVLTDGEWIWPTGYAHYVKMYAAEIPDELIAKITSLNGACPEVTKDDLSRISKEFHAWCDAVDPNFAKAQAALRPFDLKR